MRVIGSLVLALYFSYSALAAVDVTCIGGDCLTQGWRWRHTETFAHGRVECMGKDCRTIGWYGTSVTGEYFESYCAFLGCWVQGWEVVNYSGQTVAQAWCHRGGVEGESDCLTYGWTVHPPGWPNQVLLSIHCIQNDCRKNGWEILERGRVFPQRAHCKPGGCLTEGWYLYH